MNNTIYLVGNPLVDKDSMPLKLAPLLRKEFKDINFVEFDPTENLPEDTKKLIMIDTVEGLDEPRIFNDIEQFITQKHYSMHDFDLGWQLKLYKKLRMVEEIQIIGVPEKGELKRIVEKVKKLISS